MKENKEIAALLQLIDDPDEEVYSTISNRIIDYGRNIIPNLENLWETTVNEHVQSRIEMLIHKLHFIDICDELKSWRSDPERDILRGAFIISKLQYPDLAITPILQEIEKIRRNIWLELNSFLTPLEQAHVLSSILYSYYKLQSQEVAYQQPDIFLPHKVLQTKKGNAYSIGLLYYGLANLLNLPVKVINIPRQFVLAYYNENMEDDEQNVEYPDQYHFFVDPSTGRPFTHDDIENYFKRISVPIVPSYFKPLTHKQILVSWMEEFSKCFQYEDQAYKQQDIDDLIDIIQS